MFEYTRYYDQFQGFRGNLGGLPSWARFVVGIAAIPGIVLLGLSILAFLVSLAALLLLTVPVYRLMRALTQPRPGDATTPHRPGAKRVEVTVVHDRPV
jgi:hypothetical protein